MSIENYFKLKLSHPYKINKKIFCFIYVQIYFSFVFLTNSIQMIRKCNTAQSKQSYTPYNGIKVSQFLQNQQQWPLGSPASQDTANDELNLNILKIKQCKQQTEHFLSQMNYKINAQNEAIRALQSRSLLEREKSKNIRAKYHEALINLRRKEEDNERIQRCLQQCRQRFEFVTVQSSSALSQWLHREERYKRQIVQLEEIIHRQAQTTLLPQRHIDVRGSGTQETSLEGLGKTDESTFI